MSFQLFTYEQACRESNRIEPLDYTAHIQTRPDWTVDMDPCFFTTTKNILTRNSSRHRQNKRNIYTVDFNENESACSGIPYTFSKSLKTMSMPMASGPFPNPKNYTWSFLKTIIKTHKYHGAWNPCVFWTSLPTCLVLLLILRFCLHRHFGFQRWLCILIKFLILFSTETRYKTYGFTLKCSNFNRLFSLNVTINWSSS